MTSLKDLVTALSDETGFTKTDCRKMYKALVLVVKKEANSADSVIITLPEIGKITVKVQEARVGKNPATGEDIEIPAKKVARCKIFPAFNKDIN